MQKVQGFDEAITFTGDYETLEPGGYICVIKNVVVEKTRTGKEALKIALDIAEGEHKDYYKRQFENKKKFSTEAKWGGTYSQLTEGNSLPFFKGFITAIENSNNGYKWNWDENTLKGKLFGGVFGEEEFVGNDGNVKRATKCMQIRSVEQVRKGVKVPPLKTLGGNSTSPTIPDAIPVEDEYLPF